MQPAGWTLSAIGAARSSTLPSRIGAGFRRTPRRPTAVPRRRRSVAATHLAPTRGPTELGTTSDGPRQSPRPEATLAEIAPSCCDGTTGRARASRRERDDPTSRPRGPRGTAEPIERAPNAQSVGPPVASGVIAAASVRRTRRIQRVARRDHPTPEQRSGSGRVSASASGTCRWSQPLSSPRSTGWQTSWPRADRCRCRSARSDGPADRGVPRPRGTVDHVATNHRSSDGDVVSTRRRAPPPSLSPPPSSPVLAVLGSARRPTGRPPRPRGIGRRNDRGRTGLQGSVDRPQRRTDRARVIARLTSSVVERSFCCGTTALAGSRSPTIDRYRTRRPGRLLPAVRAGRAAHGTGGSDNR